MPDGLPPPALDDAVLRTLVEPELARPLAPPFLPADLLAPDDAFDEPLFRPLPVLAPELERFDVDGLLPDDTFVLLDRPPPVDDVRPAGTIVSAAAPTAPTAAPVAAPVRISPATPITLSTILVAVEREEPR